MVYLRCGRCSGGHRRLGGERTGTRLSAHVEQDALVGELFDFVDLDLLDVAYLRHEDLLAERLVDGAERLGRRLAHRRVGLAQILDQTGQVELEHLLGQRALRAHGEAAGEKERHLLAHHGRLVRQQRARRLLDHLEVRRRIERVQGLAQRLYHVRLLLLEALHQRLHRLLSGGNNSHKNYYIRKLKRTMKLP